MYLVTCDYSSDAERKRIEYVFSKVDSDSVDRITGASRIICDDDIEGLISELYSRTASENVRVYRLSPVETEVSPSSRTVEMELGMSRDSVEFFLSYLLAQRRSVFKKSMGPGTKVYESVTKKGYAKITSSVKEKASGISVKIVITAEEPNLSYLNDFFAEQLELFKNSMDG